MRTVLEPPRTRVEFDLPFRLNPHTAVVSSVGSCFADEVAGRLADAGLDVQRNPNGIVYNPVSLADSVLGKEADLFEFNGLWHSWNHHGSFSSASRGELEQKIENARSAFREHLRKSDLLILTPASAVVFQLIENQQIVAPSADVSGVLCCAEFHCGVRCIICSGMPDGVYPFPRPPQSRRSDSEFPFQVIGVECNT